MRYAASTCRAADATDVAVTIEVSEEAGVNHNYEREHALNLWFVVTGSDAPSVARTLGRIGARTGLPVLDLPLERSYFIDLGFPLERRGDWKSRLGRSGEAQRRPCGISAEERSLLTAIEAGLPLIPSPFAVVARGLGEEI